MSGKPLPITGTGRETRDFTFVADTVAGMIGAALGDTRPGDVFNLGTGQETAIADLATRINELTGNAAGTEQHPQRSWDHAGRRLADVSKARDAFGYAPSVDLDEGLHATHEWLVSVSAESRA
jgi:nucleoside-diphosphate-sugar epimerase